MGNHHLPNIILVVCDTLGAKHMSLYGYERRTTPYLERMAADDGFVVYNKCFSPAAWTVPSHVSFFTGLYPKEHGVDDDNVCLPDNFYYLPEILRYLDFTTHGVTSNGLVSGLLGFHRGFDEFHEMWNFFNSKSFFAVNQAFSASKKTVDGELERFLLLLRLSRSHPAYTFPFKKFINTIYKKINGIHAIHKKSVHATMRTIDTAKKIISSRGNAPGPFFLFLNIMETHSQYNPPSGIDAFRIISRQERSDALDKMVRHHYAFSPFSAETFEILNVLYDREVLFLDSVLWDFFSFLRNKKILDNTIVIITSDHGEFIGEHGQFNHVFTLYNELLHVPLLIKFPKEYVLRGRRDYLVQLHDIFATIADATDSPLPVPESSLSLLSSDRRNFAYSQILSCDRPLRKFRQTNPSLVLKDFMQPHASLITDGMIKIIKRADGHVEIYDLNQDLYETNELSNEPSYAERKQELSRLIEVQG